MVYLIQKNKHRELGKMRRQRNMFQTREQDKNLVKELNEMKISKGHKDAHKT